jgi:hypothetical protein
MRAEFYRPDAPKKAVGVATWSRRGVEVKAEGEGEATIRRIFRPTPLVVDDPTIRPAGTSGPVVLHPGTLLWFRSAGDVRGKEEGLAVRFVPEGQDVMGWDPAGAYRSFSESVERKELNSSSGRVRTRG